MLGYIEYLDVPVKVAVVIIALFFVMQLIGEVLEFKGKVVPELFKIRKFFTRRKREREETVNTLKEVQKTLGEVNSHYSEDNITKRNEWMQWVNDRAEVYDASIEAITKSLSEVTAALNANTGLTEEMFVQQSRDRIIDFSYKAADYSIPVSREEYHRIFKVYDKYEKFLDEHEMTNGEIDTCMSIIKESYEERMKNHLFAEDLRARGSETI